MFSFGYCTAAKELGAFNANVNHSLASRSDYVKVLNHPRHLQKLQESAKEFLLFLVSTRGGERIQPPGLVESTAQVSPLCDLHVRQHPACSSTRRELLLYRMLIGRTVQTTLSSGDRGAGGAGVAVVWFSTQLQMLVFYTLPLSVAQETRVDE
jgi:hypothetical protein